MCQHHGRASMPCQYELSMIPEGEEVDAGSPTAEGSSLNTRLTSSAFLLKISSFASKSYSGVHFSKPTEVTIF